MDVEAIKAIGGLWPLALVLFFCIGLVIFRKQLQSLLDDLLHIEVKKGDTGFALNRQGKDAAEPPKAVEVEPTSQESGIVADSESPRERFFMLIRKGDTPKKNSACKIALEWTNEAIEIRDNIRKTAAVEKK